MADNVFSPTASTAPRDLATIARETRVPVNFLEAFVELAPDVPEDRRPAAAASIAAQIAPRMARGETIEDVVKSLAGDDKAASAFIERAYQIADEKYPAPEVPKDGGFRKAVGMGVDVIQQSYGSAVEGLGKAIGSGAVED